MKEQLNCVLLVDDDPATNFINKITVEKSGLVKKVAIAKNGLEGLNYVKDTINDEENAPCMILLDINMPAMNGWEFLEEYSKIKREAPIPVIVMLTTSLNPDDKQRADKINEITSFKNKPLTEDVFQDIYNTYFETGV